MRELAAGDIGAYDRVYAEACKFLGRHPGALWCIGNHEGSYLWGMPETGHSDMARLTALRGQRDITGCMRDPSQTAVIHRIGKAVFSHAGAAAAFAGRREARGGDPKGHGRKGSRKAPVAVRHRVGQHIRAQGACHVGGGLSRVGEAPEMYMGDMLHVVGHTPVREPPRQGLPEGGGALTLDTFSARQDGSPIGGRRFVVVDTDGPSREEAG